MLKENFTPLADDSIIVKKEDGDFFCYQTPVIDKESWIKRSSSRFKLGAIIVLKKNKSYKLVKIKSVDMFPKLFESLWLIDKKTHANSINKCLELLDKPISLLSLSLKKTDKFKLIQELPKILQFKYF